MNINLQPKGFTLIELMIYLALVILLAAIVISSLLWTFDLGNKIKAEKEVLSAQREVTRTLEYWIRESREIYTPTSSSTQLSLLTTTGKPDSEDFIYVDFYQCGSRVCMKKEFEEPIFITPAAVEVKDANFKVIKKTPSVPSVRLYLKMEHTGARQNAMNTAAIAATTTVSLRGY